MTDLHAAVDSYLTLRRSLGYQLTDHARLLPDFVDYLRRNDAEHVTTQLALAWAVQPSGAGPIWWRQRLGMVRGFAEYLHNLDPATEIPPRDLLPASQQRIAPYLYSDTDITTLMAAARDLKPPLRAATYETFIGLLVVTGLRLGEALALNRGDIDEPARLLRVRHAKRGSRRIPLHDTTICAVHNYFDTVDRHFPAPLSPALFVSIRGTRMNKDSLHATFPVLIDRAGLTGRGQRIRPRIHDLRHSFAVNQLLDWHRQRVDVDTRIPLLSAVLGHGDPVSTYWYLQAAPELFAVVGQRLDEVLGELP
ncbi:integrase [Kibdelosporangium banguiense]|uniref:Integrase n=1 Tax=Kibdelosporangium banguiense TaxID=1365924 RepID=A0ABS4TJY9_9PSEU|nr:tyrosine-type recombinase/integrase [Kibdelosporangium banguiense]MBP2324720.1 integrase [Kibdelosporangium banguiense]